MTSPIDDREYLRPPEEFPAPAEQVTPPPPEFGGGGQAAPSAGKKRKHHWLAAAMAAGLLSTVALFSGVETAAVEPLASPTPAVEAAAATEKSLPGSDPTPSPSPVPTDTPTPTPAPTAVPTPTTAPAPGVQLTFYRTSEVYHGQVVLTASESMEAVTVRLFDRVLQEPIWTYDLTGEDMARGVYAFSNYDLYAGEFVQSHLDQVRQGYEPDPVLEVAYTFRTDDGETTLTERTEAADELWVSARYDLKDPGEDFLSYFLEETTYPDCFVVRVEGTPYEDLHVSYGEDGALGSGDVSVTLLADGQPVPVEGCHLERTETTYDGGTLYAYAFVIPRPDSFPDHGAVEIRVTRRLIHYPDHTVTDIKTVEY